MTKGQIFALLAPIESFIEISSEKCKAPINLNEINMLTPFATKAEDAAEKVSVYAFENINSLNYSERELSKTIYYKFSYLYIDIENIVFVGVNNCPVDYLNSSIKTIEKYMFNIMACGEDFVKDTRNKESDDEKDKRIAELEAEVEKLKKNTQISKEDIGNIFQDDDSENTNKANSENAERIKSLEEQLATEEEKNSKLKEEVEFHKKERDEMLKELLLTIIHKESDVEEFLELIDGRSDTEIVDIVKENAVRYKISNKMKNRPLWQILHTAKIYKTTESNWNAGLRN